MRYCARNSRILANDYRVLLWVELLCCKMSQIPKGTVDSMLFTHPISHIVSLLMTTTYDDEDSAKRRAQQWILNSMFGH